MPIPCPPGKYCSVTGLYDPLTLPDCSAGYYCTFETYTVAAGDSQGFVCNKDTSATSRTCTRGSIVANQILCPKGYFCPIGSETATACPIGTFSNVTGNTDQSNCTKCGSGKFCSHRGMTTEGVNCTAGYYCPENAGLTTSTPI